MPRRAIRFRLTTLFGLTATWAISFGSLSRGPGTFFFVSTILFTSFAYWFVKYEVGLRPARARAIGFAVGTVWGLTAVAVLSVIRDEVPFGNMGFFIGAVLGGLTSLIPLACVSVLREKQLAAMPLVNESKRAYPNNTDARDSAGLWQELFWATSTQRRPFNLAPSDQRRRLGPVDLMLVLASLGAVTAAALFLEYNLFVVAFSLAVSAAVCYVARTRWKFARSDTVWLAPLAGAIAGMFLFLFDEALAMERRFGAVDYRKGAAAGALASLVVMTCFCGVGHRSKRKRRRHGRGRSTARSPAKRPVQHHGSTDPEQQRDTGIFDGPTY